MTGTTTLYYRGSPCVDQSQEPGLLRCEPCLPPEQRPRRRHPRLLGADAAGQGPGQSNNSMYGYTPIIMLQLFVVNFTSDDPIRCLSLAAGQV